MYEDWAVEDEMENTAEDLIDDIEHQLKAVESTLIAMEPVTAGPRRRVKEALEDLKNLRTLLGLFNPDWRAERLEKAAEFRDAMDCWISDGHLAEIPEDTRRMWAQVFAVLDAAPEGDGLVRWLLSGVLGAGPAAGDGKEADA